MSWATHGGRHSGGRKNRWRKVVVGIAPFVAGLMAGGALLLVLGHDPLTFYGDVLERGLFSWAGLRDTLTRMAPLLLIAVGLVVAFRAGIWNVGGDGQFLLAAAVVAGIGPWLVDALPRGVDLAVLCLLGAAVGAAWTLLPAVLKAFSGVNEIVTSLMMSFVGVNLANLLIKGPFRTTTTNVPQTDVIPFGDLLPPIPGTRVHVGIVLALVAVAVMQYVLSRTAFGLRLTVLGSGPRRAAHMGIPVRRLMVVAFAISGAFIGLAAAVEIMGVWGYVRADWNPGFGLPLFALVFIARLNTLACIPVVAFYAVFSTGGHYAARQAGLPDDVLLVLVGLILLFAALAELPAVGRWRAAVPTGPSPDEARSS